MRTELLMCKNQEDYKLHCSQIQIIIVYDVIPSFESAAEILFLMWPKIQNRSTEHCLSTSILRISPVAIGQYTSS